MISTKKIKLSASDYFKILMKLYIRKRGWLFATLLLFVISIPLRQTKSDLDIFLLFLIVLYPLAIVIQHWSFAHSQLNRIFHLERFFEVYEDKITGHLEDGTNNEIPIKYFIKHIELKKYYILYISKNQFITIPKHSFKDEKDKIWFETNFLQMIKANRQ